MKWTLIFDTCDCFSKEKENVSGYWSGTRVYFKKGKKNMSE